MVPVLAPLEGQVHLRVSQGISEYGSAWPPGFDHFPGRLGATCSFDSSEITRVVFHVLCAS